MRQGYSKTGNEIPISATEKLIPLEIDINNSLTIFIKKLDQILANFANCVAKVSH